MEATGEADKSPDGPDARRVAEQTLELAPRRKVHDDRSLLPAEYKQAACSDS
jgi:hypothetical protein